MSWSHDAVVTATAANGGSTSFVVDDASEIAVGMELTGISSLFLCSFLINSCIPAVFILIFDILLLTKREERVDFYNIYYFLF